MKKITTLLALAGVLAAPNVFAAFDGTVTLSESTFHNTTTGGGEFTANSAQYGTFQTFCLEVSENLQLSPPSTYSYFRNSGAVQGGVGAVPGADPHTGLPMDNISI